LYNCYVSIEYDTVLHYLFMSALCIIRHYTNCLCQHCVRYGTTLFVYAYTSLTQPLNRREYNKSLHEPACYLTVGENLANNMARHTRHHRVSCNDQWSCHV